MIFKSKSQKSNRVISKVRAFTLVELLVSVVLFLLAVTVALTATIGSNNLILRAESRSAITESARAVSDFLRRNTTTATTSQVTVINNVIAVKQFTTFQAGPANTCTEVGLAQLTLDANGREVYDFNAPAQNKNVIAMKISQLDLQSLACTTVFYQGQLIDKEKVQATSFAASLDDAGCEGQCSLLRYSLSLTERGIAQSAVTESRRATLSVVTSLPIGVGN